MNSNYLTVLQNLGIHTLPTDVEFSNQDTYTLIFTKPEKTLTIKIHNSELCLLKLQGKNLFINQNNPENILLIDSFNWFNQG